MIWKNVMEAAHFGLPVEQLVTSDPTLSVASIPIIPTPIVPITAAPEPADDEPTDGRIPTPELLGLTLANARNLLTTADHGIRILSVVEVEMEGTEPGTIIGQAPDVGSTMEPNGSMLVEITIEPQHPEGVVVPALTQRLLSSVTPTLEALGLGYQIVEVADPDEPEWTSGLVWSQDPAPGTVVEPGAVVILRVAP